MLEGEQAKVGKTRDVPLVRPDTEHAAHLLVRQTGIRSREFQSREDP
jgi:hypothetical protein